VRAQPPLHPDGTPFTTDEVEATATAILDLRKAERAVVERRTAFLAAYKKQADAEKRGTELYRNHNLPIRDLQDVE
jgi:hypothetical protein